MKTVSRPVAPQRKHTVQQGLRSAGALLGAWLLAEPVANAARPPWSTSNVVGTPEPPAPFRLERTFPSLNFTQPVDLIPVPGESAFLLLQQDGKILRFPARGDGGGGAPQLLLDIRAHQQPFESALSFVLHPDYPSKPYLYVNCNEPGGAANGAQVVRFTFGAGPSPTLDWNSRQVLLTWLSGGHNGCHLLFGPDRMLYISTGDASPPDPPDAFRTGQGVDDLLSSILRIDPDHPSQGRPYGIPEGNPFVGTPGGRPEVWAFGFRNPWRMAFAPDGALWVGDVGWELWELLHRVTPAYNGGWSYVEGPNPSVRSDVTPGPTPVQKPLLALPHSEAASITGGRFYAGKRIPELRGAHVFGDWETGKFWSARQQAERLVELKELCDTTIRPVSFAEDADGELLILDYNGGIYRLDRNAATDRSSEFPKTLSQTGLFQSTAQQTPSEGVASYGVRHPMWADHATAERWLGIPGQGRAVLADKWQFPTNTVFAKTLSLRMDAADPGSARRIETQLLHFDGQTWRAYSYRWDAQQKDAVLVPAEGATETLTVRDASAPGGQRVQTWRFHSRTECLRCHNPWAGNAIGFGLEQLDTAQLDALEREGWIGAVDRSKAPTRLAAPSDSSATSEALARSWLHVNCAHCHRFGAGGSVALFLNWEVDATGTRSVDERPLRGDFGLDAARVVASGAPSRSTLFYRINTEGQGHMPLIGPRFVDERSVPWIASWIRNLKPSTNAPLADLPAATSRALAHQGLVDRVLSGSESDQRQALKELLGSSSGALRLLETAAQQRTGRPGIPALWVDQGVQSANAGVRELFDRFQSPDKRRRTLGDRFAPEAVLSLRGSVERGRQLFHGEGSVSCSRCHAAEGKGRAYGPDLAAAVKKYPVADLLDQIVHPGKTIAREYLWHQVELRDGTLLGGFVVKRAVGSIVLRGEDLQERTLLPEQVASVEVSSVSAMPEGLIESLTAQEAADLMAYLLTLKSQ